MDVSDVPEREAENGEEPLDGEDERGDDDDGPDAPTAVEENEGMSTILSGDTLDGVQTNASDE
jgi:hypothetical protein